MRTFWLAITDRPDTTSSHMLSGSDSSREYQVEDKQDELRNAPPSCNRDKTSRLVDWHVEVLMRLLKRTMQQRQVDDAPGNVDWQSSKWAVSHNVRDEVAEIIELPDVVDVKTPDTGDAIVTAPIESQLRDYVVRIANLYPDHPFHNFEHASHVTMVCTMYHSWPLGF
jgi:hypothetical protein